MIDFLTNVLNNLEDPIFVKDENHIYVSVNEAFGEWFGVSVGEVVGKSDHQLFLNSLMNNQYNYNHY